MSVWKSRNYFIPSKQCISDFCRLKLLWDKCPVHQTFQMSVGRNNSVALYLVQSHVFVTLCEFSQHLGGESRLPT